MLLAVAVFVLVGLAEVWILIQVGHAIGGLATLALLVVDSILGAALLRHEGRRTWRAFRLALDQRRVPAAEVADGALVIVGGALLVAPGFLSDAVGLLCLLPPSRALLRRLLTRVVARRLLGPAGATGYRAWRAGRGSVPRRQPTGGAAPGRPAAGGRVIEGTVTPPGTDEGPPPGGRRP